MIQTLFTLHTYFIVNIAIALSYPLARGIMKLPFVRLTFSQQQQLTLARFCFLIAVTAFFSMPLIAGLLSIEHSNLEFKPVIHHASQSFLRHHETVATEIYSVQTLSSTFSLNKLFLLMWIAGFLWVLVKWMRVFSSLGKLSQHAFCLHALGRVRILLSDATSTPFCWSFLRDHFIMIPYTLLENPEDMKLAIRHELQHIRQSDTYWLQGIALLKLLCFFNPFLFLWRNWLNELQEFACDEAVILRKKVSPSDYAQCLINTARLNAESLSLKNGVLAINGLSQSILYRRINMLFSYKNKKRKLTLILAYGLSFCALTSAAYALNGTSNSAPLTSRQVSSLIRESNLNSEFHITANREVIDKINWLRSNKKAKKFMLLSLDRMKTYQPYIKEQLQKYAMPNDLLAVPLVESGYRPLPQSNTPMQAAGIWQLIPSTAERFGLVVNQEKDQRLETEASTQAALTLLSLLYKQFHDWKLSVLAYTIGEQETERLIKASGSRDAWTLMRSPHVSNEYKKEVTDYLAMLDASIIIMHNPALIAH